MNFPEIPPVPDEIINASDSGKLVVFVGAGVSQIIGCPSWKKFAKNYLEYLFEKGFINYSEFLHLGTKDSRQILSICQDTVQSKRLDPAEFQGLLKKLLKADDDLLRKSTIYSDLYGLKAAFVTTNYDEYFDEVAPDEKVIAERADLLSVNLKKENILHLHGSVKKPTEIVMTLIEYLQSYDDDSHQAALLSAIFDNTVLFVGYGLEEFEVLEYMVGKIHKRDQKIQHFMLYPILNEEDNLFKMLQTYYDHIRIKLIPYPIRKYGYKHLGTVIKDWSQKIGPGSKPPLVIERRKLIEQVLNKGL